MRNFVHRLISRLVNLFLRLGLEVRIAGRGSGQLHSELRKALLTESTGVLHIGAHDGQESSFYNSLGCRVLWVEANPSVFQRLEARIAPFSSQKAKLALLGNKKTIVDFHIAENDGQSSSVFEFGAKSRFNLQMSRTLKLKMMRLSDLCTPTEIKKYSHWVIDVQGAEKLVLEGAENYLKYCASLDIEVSTYETYKGGVQLDELVAFLSQHGFVPVWKFSKNSHGNLIFVRARFSI